MDQDGQAFEAPSTIDDIAALVMENDMGEAPDEQEPDEDNSAPDENPEEGHGPDDVSEEEESPDEDEDDDKEDQ